MVCDRTLTKLYMKLTVLNSIANGMGKKRLTDCAKEVSKSDWRELPLEEKARLVKNLEEHRESVRKPIKVSGMEVRQDIEGTMGVIERDVSSIQIQIN